MVILGKTLLAKQAETILGGSDICRFEIELTNVEYKGKRHIRGINE
jgi:hypothetical protein